ncbi:hypothetical protein SEA_MARIETTA_80 [Gordonia phage Marietta]|uniref:Uncharacterized protein n=1 Tax=Gordonia phage Marietta TaxID=2301558 RepID=A0A385DS57_9CAUD|nr:hypothetical protein KNU07_gp80 [Gordonia phage Marietta]AXQ61399.1 hypothetical protein SEA_MARIETTA_80 [Gordonia phage Marietta]
MINTPHGVTATVDARTTYAYGSRTATGTLRTATVTYRSGYGYPVPVALNALRGDEWTPSAHPAAWDTPPTHVDTCEVSRYLTPAGAQRVRSELLNGARRAQSAAWDLTPGRIYTGARVTSLTVRTNRVCVVWDRRELVWWEDVYLTDAPVYLTHRDGVREIADVRQYLDGVMYQAVDGVRYDADTDTGTVRVFGRTLADVVRCLDCGRAWDDAHTTGVTPSPSGRCPFEHDHGLPVAQRAYPFGGEL